MADLILSASSVNRYLSCELAYYFGYVALERGEQSWEKVIGLAVHSAVETAYGRMQQLKPPHAPAQINIAKESHLDLNAQIDAESRRSLIAHGKLGYAKAKDEAHRVLDAYWATFPPESTRPELVEVPFEIDVEGVAFSGTIDRVDRTYQYVGVATLPDVRLRDLKTVASRPQKGKYRLNMIGYWLGLRESKGVEADSIVLDYFVRTKTPYHWPEWREPPDDDDIDWFVATVQGVAEGIGAGRYRPTGLDSPYECKVCPWQKICGPHNRMQGKED